MADNEELDPPSPHDILNVFVAAEFSSCSSSDSDKYKRAYNKAKVTRYPILSDGECIGACIRASMDA